MQSNDETAEAAPLHLAESQAEAPTPWKFVHTDYDRVEDSNGHVVMDNELTRRPVQKRVVACVNACAGMADPEGEIGAMRSLLKAAASDILRRAKYHATRFSLSTEKGSRKPVKIVPASIDLNVDPNRRNSENYVYLIDLSKPANSQSKIIIFGPVSTVLQSILDNDYDLVNGVVNHGVLRLRDIDEYYPDQDPKPDRPDGKTTQEFEEI
jgi:hypothetical protein